MSSLQRLLADSSYAANPLSYATGVSAAAILLLGLAAVMRDRASKVSLFLLMLTAAATGWLGSFTMMYASAVADVAALWARVGNACAALIPAAVFHFAAVQVGEVKKCRRCIAVFWSLCGIAAAITGAAPIFLRGVRRYEWGFYPQGTPVLAVWAAFYVGILIYAMRLFWTSYRTSEGKARERSGALMLAFGLASVGVLDWLPALGIDVYPIGHVTTFGFAIVASAVIRTYRLVDVTPEFAASQILETMKGAVMVADMDGRIRVVNRGACAMLGREASELIGTHLKSVIHRDDNVNTGQFLNSTGVLEQQMVWRGAEGVRIDVLASSSFVRDASGTPLAVVYVASDYTERKRAEGALRESEHRYRSLFENNPLPMWVYDFESLRFVAVNDAAVRHYGYTRDEFLRMKITDIRPQEDVAAVLAMMPNLEERRGPAVYRHTKKDGTVIDVEITSFEFLAANRRTRLVIAQDVTERRRHEEELRRSEERFRLLFERNLAGVYRTTVDGRILDCNDALARIFGCATREELLAETAQSFYFDDGERQRLLQMLREQKSLSNVEVRMRRRDGTPVWVIESVTMLDGDPPVFEGTIIDITDRKAAQEQMEYQAYHDLLTGLPNRLLFRDRITVALAHARRHRRSSAVMFLDLDQFKLVNDTLGHTAGDRLLQEASRRLVACVRADDTVARMGGDEFTILLADIPDRRAASTVAQKVVESMREPILVDGHELFVTTSVGIAMYPEDGVDAETLLKNADSAMYRAKEAGRNTYEYATPSAFDRAEGRLALERSMHYAFEREEFVIHYQPMVEVATGRVVGAEALVRWNHPENGLMQPDDFIPLAEECQLIIPLGELVLRKACRQMKEWHDAGHVSLRVAVNLSARQFQQRDLAATIERVLAETRLPPHALDIEITESAAMQNAELSLAVISRLKEMGIRISIDDFGTGYSSLSYLKRFPIDTLKIDQNFVRDLKVTAQSADAAIISAVISIARALKLDVIAEGVETAEQLAFLQREQCAVVQGFLHSRPLPPEEFERAMLTPLREPMLPIARVSSGSV